MKSKLLTILLSLLMAMQLTVAAPAMEVRKVTSLNKDWRFTLGDNPEYREPSYNDKRWRKIDVPHDWSIEGEYQPNKVGGARNGFFPEGIGWYRRTLLLPAEKSTKKFTIEFDGIYMNAEVWINGTFLGRRPFGFVRQQYDISSHIRWGEENIVAVRVDNSLTESTRWYNGSGIYRNVKLIEQNYVHFRNDRGVYITTPVVEQERAELKAKYTIMGSYFSDAEFKRYKKNRWTRHSQYSTKPVAHDCTVRTTLYDAEGRQLSSGEQQVEIYNYSGDVEVESTLEVENPNLWSAENPYLYSVKSEIIYNDKVYDDVVTKIGVRKIEYRPYTGMFVNGEPTKLWGVCLHHDGGGAVGVAVPKKVWEYRLSKLKEIGCNAVRTGHTPMAPEFFDICDSIGIYVYSEVFDEWRFGWAPYDSENGSGKALNGYHLYFEQLGESDLRDVIRRDRNHPSIIMYGIGNEIADFRKDWTRAQATAVHLNEICAEEDPTRIPAIGNSNGECGVVESHKVIGFNSVGMNFKVKPAARDFFKYDYERRPGHLFMTSETSIDSDYYIAARDNSYVIGMFIWTGFNYFGEVKNNTKQMPLRGWKISAFDMSGGLLSQGALVSSWWAREPYVHLTSSLEDPTDPNNLVFVEETFERVMQNSDSHNWNYAEGVDSVSVTAYANTPEVELFMNGISQGVRSLDRDTFFTTWRVPYTKGKIEAVGLDGGKRLVSDELESTSAPDHIVATPHFATLKRDGEDVNIIEVQLHDSMGRLVTNAENEIAVSVKGGAKLLGIDSGSLYYDGSYATPRRKATAGRLIVVVKSTGEDAAATITLTSRGVKSAEVVL